jgi:hypothetical protein
MFTGCTLPSFARGAAGSTPTASPARREHVVHEMHGAFDHARAAPWRNAPRISSIGWRPSLSPWLERAFQPKLHVICTSRPTDHIASGSVTQGILNGISRSEAALAFPTPHAMKSPWVYHEMGVAQARRKPFIPC